MSKSIEEQILSILKKKGRGYIFFPSDFAKIANNKSILKALERLTNDGRIIRVAQGKWLLLQYQSASTR